MNHYLNLDQGDNYQACYVWIDGTGEALRNKSRTLKFKNPDHKDKGVLPKPEELPTWNYDGSSTGQAEGHNSDRMLKPVRVFPDPFNKLPNILVLCEVYNHDWSPAGTNHRFSCAKTMQKAADSKPWFGLEQEYTLLDADGEFFFVIFEWF